MRTFSRGIQGIAVIAAAQLCLFVGCNQTPPAEDGSGGSPAATGGSASGGGGSGGSPATGGQGGGDCGQFGGEFEPSEGECGTCSKSIEDFCDDVDCSMPEDLECDASRLPVVTIYRGCGFVQRRAVGDVGDAWSYYWEESTGELVYYHSVPGNSFSDECFPNRAAGERPDCDEWVMDCEGGGGAGGEGGEGGGP